MRLGGSGHGSIKPGAHRQKLEVRANDDDVECRDLVTGSRAADWPKSIYTVRVWQVEIMLDRAEAVPEAKDWVSIVCVCR